MSIPALSWQARIYAIKSFFNDHLKRLKSYLKGVETLRLLELITPVILWVLPNLVPEAIFAY